MIALKCDNCGRYFDFDDLKSKNFIRVGHMDDCANLYNSESMTLCPACMAAITKALEDRKRRSVDPMEDDLK